MSNELYGAPLTFARDGYGWLESLQHSRDHDRVQYNKWAKNLATAEITGYNTYLAVVKAFQNPLEHWNGTNLEPYIYHAKKIAGQEAGHYHIVSSWLEIKADPVDHEATFAELDLNERRSEMRLSTILAASDDPHLIGLANRLIVDEAYHCWYTRLVLKELGDFSLPRLT